MGAGARDRKNAITLFNHVERKIDAFLASSERGKTCVRVVYATGGHNESVTSSDRHYLLYALSCFLEDDLSDDVLNRVLKQYEKQI